MPQLVSSGSDPYVSAVNNIMQGANAQNSYINDVNQAKQKALETKAAAYQFQPYGSGGSGYNTKTDLGNNDYNSGVVGNILNEAKKYLGTAYKWGGASPKTGFDCSGLIKYTYNKYGINVPRTSAQQYAASQHITAAQARSGDLVFFKSSSGTVHHVGIYLGNGRYLESPHTGDVVKIANFSPSGAYFGRFIK